MNRWIKILTLVLVTLVAAGWVIKETKLNEDFSIWINDGGVAVEAIKVEGTTSDIYLAPTTGKVGIGTTAPDYTLDVDKSVAGDWLASIVNPSATGFGLQVIGASNSVSQEIFKVRKNTTDDAFIVYGNGRLMTQSVVGTNIEINESTTDTTPQINVTQASTGDAGIGFVVSGVTAWNIGVDNSDSDALVFGDNAGGTIGSDTVLKLATNGAVTIPAVGGGGGNVPHACARRTKTCAASTTCTTDTTNGCAADEFAMGGGCDTAGAFTMVRAYVTNANQYHCQISSSTDITAIVTCCDY